MTDRPVLAVDFGTTKTYLSKCPPDDPSPVSVDFGDGRDGILTAILYREGKPPLIGETALDEYGEATEAERKGFRLLTNFKPEIASSQEARTAASDYLSAVLGEARRQRLDVDPTVRHVLFGVPSEADDIYRTALQRTAEAAGYGTPDLLDEPKGALLYHLKQRDISVDQALSGVLVVDFGGGTCDFALLDGGHVVHSWGDMHLGGRLFDDLFYRWMTDQTPGLERDLEEKGAAYFVGTCLCREAKEFFSRSMARDRTLSISKVFPRYGRLTGLTWEEFLRRGRRYTPSKLLRETFQGTGDFSLPEEPRDLFSWFRESLVSGLPLKDGEWERISLVILSGGSSLWPFVPDILKEELPHLGEQAVLRSDRPYAVISMGIALLPALKKKFVRVRNALKDELPAFIEEEVRPLLERRSALVEDKIVTWTSAFLFQQGIRPVLEDFRKKGGTLTSLQEKMKRHLELREGALQEIIEKNLPLLLSGLSGETKERLAEWFSAHGIALPGKPLALTADSPESGIPILSAKTVGIDGLFDTVRILFGGLLTAMTAVLCGGAGTALIATGPLGFVAGGILGATIAYLLARYGKERARGFVEELNLPPSAAAFLVDDKKIAALQEELTDNLRAHLRTRLAPVRSQLEGHIKNLVQEEMDALNEVNSF